VRVAFHAPLKPADHPVPSGDRRIARALLGLLGDLGHEVVVASRYRTYDRTGAPARQARLAALAPRVADRAIRHLRRHGNADLWLTYHCYHKAPDLIGPMVVRRLDLPYMIIEPSIAPRRADGPWAVGYAAAREALRSADLLLPMTSVDADTLARAIDPPPPIRLFPPFLDATPYRRASAERVRHRAELARRYGLDPAQPWLLAVAMMRADVKRLSYLALADALERLPDHRWQLLVVGDGDARPELEGRLARLGPDRCRLLGALDEPALLECYAAADLLVWPAFEEAYGMALLEAQAAALPVLACREGGVADIIMDGETGVLVAGRDSRSFAAALRALLEDERHRRALGAAAAAHVRARHDRPVAADRLRSAIAEATDARATVRVSRAR
jgi:glycosyltransferase involved in cell wall biosynthesis